jgi:hypothetical protein
MIIGYTGTRQGMTIQQVEVIRVFFSTNSIEEAHHGDCIGGDEEFHNICKEYGVPIVIHPPDDDRLRAFCQGAMRVEEPKPFLVRNQCIVNASDLLLATPKEEFEPDPMRGQGTWSTVRYARRTSRLFRIIWPEGEGALL